MKSKETEKGNEQIIEQLRAESKLKTKWLSLIAHDFKGLFSNIQLLLGAMADQSITPELFMSMLPELRELAERNSKTIQDTLAWVNTQNDGFNPNIEPVLIHSLFVELLEEHSKAITEKNLSFKFVGSEATKLNTDRFLLRFVLNHLVENAIKYSNKGDVVELIVYSDSDKVNISVKDNGVGMVGSQLNAIGTLDSSPYTGTMNEKGAGLSLVIVKDFVEMLNGTMKVSSVEDKGTLVELKF